MSIQRRDRPTTAVWVPVNIADNDATVVMPVPGGMVVGNTVQMRDDQISSSLCFVPCTPDQMEEFIGNSVYQKAKAEEDGGD
jgi:hypothetical protein